MLETSEYLSDVRHKLARAKSVRVLALVVAAAGLSLAGCQPRDAGPRLDLSRMAELIEPSDPLLAQAITLAGSRLGSWFELPPTDAGAPSGVRVLYVIIHVERGYENDQLVGTGPIRQDEVDIGVICADVHKDAVCLAGNIRPEAPVQGGAAFRIQWPYRRRYALRVPLTGESQLDRDVSMPLRTLQSPPSGVYRLAESHDTTRVLCLEVTREGRTSRTLAVNPGVVHLLAGQASSDLDARFLALNELCDLVWLAIFPGSV